jgi:hypothetical protein
MYAERFTNGPYAVQNNGDQIKITLNVALDWYLTKKFNNFNCEWEDCYFMAILFFANICKCR